VFELSVDSFLAGRVTFGVSIPLGILWATVRISLLLYYVVLANQFVAAHNPSLLITTTSAASSSSLDSRLPRLVLPCQ
ncbi:MAG: hypothetical protein ACRD2L_14285, partial [Terriglobia bacterium]